MTTPALEKSPSRNAAGGRSMIELPPALAMPGALVISEEESPVAHDRSAHGGAELVLMKSRPRLPRRIGEEVVGIQLVVAQELEYRAVELIGAALDGGIDHRARRVTEFRREGAGLDFEFLHRVHRGRNRDAVASDRASVGHGIVIDSVQRDLVRGEAAAARDEREIRPHAEHGRRVAGEQTQRKGIPSVERQFEDLLVLDHLAQRRCLGLQQRSHFLDFDHLAHLARLQGDTDGGRLVHLKHHLLDRRLLEAGESER